MSLDVDKESENSPVEEDFAPQNSPSEEGLTPEAVRDLNITLGCLLSMHEQEGLDQEVRSVFCEALLMFYFYLEQGGSREIENVEEICQFLKSHVLSNK